MLKIVWNYLKNPIYEEDENTDFKYRFAIVIRLVIYALIVSLILLAISGTLESVFNLEVGKHAMEDILDESPWVLLISVVIAAPLFEELIFRGPMSLFKESPYFKYVFYTLTLIFGYIHIFNFEMNISTILLSPFLVAPQISIGAFLGYIRVRFGLLWSMLFHATYNLILAGPLFVGQLLDIPLE